MALPPGTRLGPYEIVSLLGVGGMGEVYRARDTRLERTVAIKILSQLSNDPAHKQRFEREARTISSLNHPNICTLYDIGQQDGIDYLVMECVEGETLAKRLEKGPLPVDQVLKVGAQIADALDKAHRSGIVHRDVKPSNIVLTSTGAKLLDFGLAKPASALVDVAMMTATKMETPVTERGTIVGTFQYMSPEQVEGRELDGRSDIFSLGTVLYEMVTGQRTFDGKSRFSVASAILEKDPAPITTLKPLAPIALDHAIRTCLAKDPDNRWQTARDLSHELKWIGEAGSQAGAPAVATTPSRGTARIAWMVAAVLLAALGLFGAAYFKSKETSPSALVVRSRIPPPADMQFNPFVGGMWLPAISPDGTHIVFPVRDSRGVRLWLRATNDTGDGSALPGTENGGLPFWSPDGRSIGFFADGKLKRIDIEGNLVRVLCEVASTRGAAWNQDGVILFEPTQLSPIYQVPASGGIAKPVTEINATRKEQSHRWPVFLPDGKHFLFFVRSEENPEIGGVYAGSLDSKDYHLVIKTNSGPAFVVRGTLVYVRDEVVVTQHFDEKRLVTSGEPVALPDRVAFNRMNSSALFSVSPAGLMLYYPATSGGPQILNWRDREGKRGDSLDSAFFYGPISLSPDGTQAALSIFNSDGLSSDLWSLDLNRATKTRLTSGPEQKAAPVWQPDGQFLMFFASFTAGAAHIDRIKSDGTGIRETVFKQEDFVYIPSSVCRQGNYLAVTRRPKNLIESGEPWILPLTGEPKPFPLAHSQSIVTSSAFSPDCTWVAYISNETGESEVYVTHFPDTTRRYRVSTQGGAQPRWRGDGKELFYLSPARNSILAVSVDKKADSISLGTPRTLFSSDGATLFSTFDVTADGQRFLIAETNSPKSTVPLTLVTNWNTELKTK